MTREIYDDLSDQVLARLAADQRGELATETRPELAAQLRQLAHRYDLQPADVRRQLLRLAITGMTDAEIDDLVSLIARAHRALVAGGAA